MRSLLADDHWEPVIEALRGKRWGYAQLLGNAGDDLIRMGAFDLMDRNGIEYVQWAGPSHCEGLLLSGGGNIGGRYERCTEARTILILEAQKHRLPVVSLPQSILPNNMERLCGVKVFVREKASLAAMPSATLCPDMALAFTPRKEYEAKKMRFLALRRDSESVMPKHFKRSDPTDLASNGYAYLDVASRFGKIVTDRLHFAIAGLIVGAKTTLLPNGYYKNRAMWETSLADLGCLWRDLPE